MSEEKKVPNFKGDGLAIWENTDKNGKRYLTVRIFNSINVNCWAYTPKVKA